VAGAAREVVMDLKLKTAGQLLVLAHYAGALLDELPRTEDNEGLRDRLGDLSTSIDRELSHRPFRMKPAHPRTTGEVARS
jgi:hypothetical protein